MRSHTALQDARGDTLGRQLNLKVFAIMFDDKGQTFSILIEEHQTIGAIRVLRCYSRQASRHVARNTNASRAWFESFAQMTNHVVVAAFVERGIVF